MKVFSENKKAYYNYEILEKFEAGIALIGQEVKSIRLGRLNLAGSYVIINNEEVYLIGAKIPAYQPKNAGADYNEERQRKLLLNKKEINHLMGISKERGFSLIPLKVYDKSGRVKLELGLAKGKKKYNKKEKIKKREMDREVNRALSRG